MTLVKICGIRSVPEGRVALESGANLLGFVFWKPSKRYITPVDASRIIAALRAESLAWSAVGVFVDPLPADVRDATDLCGLDYIQLSGDEPRDLVATMPRPTVKALHVRAGSEAAAADAVASNAFGAERYLLDTHAELPGGTGLRFDWAALKDVGRDCFVAGGLKPENVATALETLAPHGVDVSSGVEYPSGGKDPRLIRAFLEAVRTHDQRSN